MMDTPPERCPLCQHPESCRMDAYRFLTDFYQCPRCGRYMLVDGWSFVRQHRNDLFRLACVAHEWHLREGGGLAPPFLLVTSGDRKPLGEPKDGQRIVTPEEMLDLFPQQWEVFDRALLNISRLVTHVSEKIEMPWEDWSYVLFCPKDDIMQHVQSMEELGYVRSLSKTRGAGILSVGSRGWARLKELSAGVGQAASGTPIRATQAEESATSSVTSRTETQEMEQENPTREVFVVHGHDDALRSQVCRLLEHLDLVPVVLSEQPDGGRVLIEKFEQHSNVAYAVVLLTPDDEGRLGTTGDLKPRARQNVVFELGFFCGKLSRHCVCAREKRGGAPVRYSRLCLQASRR